MERSQRNLDYFSKMVESFFRKHIWGFGIRSLDLSTRLYSESGHGDL